MPVFSEQMQALCDAVYASKCERSAAVADIKVETEQQLSANRQHQQAVRDEQQETAARLKSDLADDCQQRSERVETFRDQVRSDHRAAADQLKRQLDDNLRERQEDVNSLLGDFHQAQQDWAEQCQAASQAWRDLATRRQVASQDMAKPSQPRRKRAAETVEAAETAMGDV